MLEIDGKVLSLSSKRYITEAIVQGCSVKKMVLEISQNSQENICATASFLIKLQEGLYLY